ncbi:MAG: D-alanyl-lipoteichoic acid biosynthesis protein DltD [Lactococcus lactis]|uniref:Protein DltD n=2 Tax=Lactococcus lactis subsp. cremoris TaxID=1359 RepID=T0WQE7_LACLC|nr:D-alanyl-lipoteichoic acid biosynthesis protein DltD [Lactococcus cremoris]EQC95434.1 cytochrome C551 [Lactococcus cremoris subsp. cremoris TIFN3]MDU1526146.1 D-alanyl-lipoteichoic acid biosynthesis protein DltD [Lactococcus lactis]MCT4400173.1 D-alanyl-lipoteichoic acid biosynthesis protein DltD [Lactococcus cremoris]MCT4427896.1 D-alanyl-lipoteichoic acid biosynthesis protein DltD [Lactococcus cremoris]MDU2185441.1 D-alanyl-lipoteichoic acid biosynthesis protein DltD [Lactococcus lactis]
MKIKIFRAIGPLIAALVLVALLIFLPFNVGMKYSKDQLVKFAQSPLNTPTFTGYSIKKQAYSDPEFLPVLGSSEMEHVDSFHPSAYFRKYNSGFIPFLVGQPGTTTLTHFFYMNSVADELKNRKIVFVISPQWFSKQGIVESELKNFVSKGEIYGWLKEADPKAATTTQLAKHLLKFRSLKSEETIYNSLERLAAKKPLTALQKMTVATNLQFWRKEDLLFSNMSQFTADHLGLSPKINKFAKELPNDPTSENLNRLAVDQGEKSSNNNPFKINNNVWNQRIKSKYKHLENYKKKVSYLESPEYQDFQQLLNVFAENHNDVLFVIQPVNGSWSSYTGVSEETLQNFSSKIKTQLRSQGFNQIADLTDMYNTPYASGDTVHFGTKGWLATDKAIEKFMKTPSNLKYHIDNSLFLSKDWAMNGATESVLK